MQGLRSSNEPVLDIGHTVLLNWGAYSLPVIRQLAQANKEGRLDNGRVVVLSEQCREEVAQEVKEELTKNPGPPGRFYPFMSGKIKVDSPLGKLLATKGITPENSNQFEGTANW